MASLITVTDSQPISLQESLSVDFVDNRLSNVHPAWGSIDPVFNSQNHCFVPRSEGDPRPIRETSEMVRQKELFLGAIARYESKSGQKFDLKMQDPDAYSLDDVIQEMELVQGRYQNIKKDGVLGRFRDCCRKFKSLKRPVESWLRLLPSDSWQGCLLCGGLKIVVSAAGRIGEMREDVSKALQQIPITIERVQGLWCIYNSETLESHISQLFVASLEVLQQCLVWFTRSPGVKVANALLKGEDFGQELQEAVDRLQLLESRIDQQANLDQHRSVNQLHHENKALYEGQKYLEFVVTNSVHRMLDCQERTTKVLEYLETERQAAMCERRQLEHDRKKIVSKQIAWILHQIEYDPVPPVDNLKQAIGKWPDFEERKQEKAAWMLRSIQKSGWLSGSQSQMLIINGQEANHESYSTVSVLSGMLVQGVKLSKAGVVLHYFCGSNLHGDTASLTASLLGQLLTLRTGVKLPLSKLVGRTDTDFENCDTLVPLFKQCLQAQLQETSVFIIMDSVSTYEDRRRVRDLRHLFGELASLAAKCQGDTQLRVLATSPTQCTYLGTFYDKSGSAVIAAPDVLDNAHYNVDQQALMHGLSKGAVATKP